jgi:hypothetical protein
VLINSQEWTSINPLRGQRTYGNKFICLCFLNPRRDCHAGHIAQDKPQEHCHLRLYLPSEASTITAVQLAMMVQELGSPESAFGVRAQSPSGNGGEEADSIQRHAVSLGG